MDTVYQLSKIRRSLKAVRDPLLRERLRLVKAYYETGSLREAGTSCGCSYGTIKYWRDRYEAKGLQGLGTRPRSGRPRQLKGDTEITLRREIVRESARQHWQIKQIREYIAKKGKVRYSLRHTIRILQRWGLTKLTPRPQYAHAREDQKKAFLKGNGGITGS